MDSISDPGRPSRRDRRRAQKLVDTAFAEQRLTAADRALRTQRIDAAHTKGDLVMITRDLVAPAATDLGRALDPSVVSPTRMSSAKTTGSSATVFSSSSTPTIDLTGIGRKVRLFVLLAVGGVLVSCVLGLVAFIPAVIEGFQEATNAPWEEGSSPGAVGSATTDGPADPASRGRSASLHTVAGWTGLVDAIKAESGSARIYDLVVYPDYAAVGLDGDGAIDRRFYRDGDWQASVSIRSPVNGSPVDLAQIDPELIARLPADTAQEVGIDDPTGTYILVNAFIDEPRIMVYVQKDVESQYRAYRLDGSPIN